MSSASVNERQAEPRLAFLADVSVHVGEPLVVGETLAGLRRVVPILGGAVSGRIAGVVEAGGADFQILRRDGAAELEARYTVLTHTGDRVYICNYGLRHGPKAAVDALARGELVDPALIYFRTAPRFETGAPDLLWLTQRVFVATGVRRPDRVELRIYELL